MDFFRKPVMWMLYDELCASADNRCATTTHCASPVHTTLTYGTHTCFVSYYLHYTWDGLSCYKSGGRGRASGICSLVYPTAQTNRSSCVGTASRFRSMLLLM